jgi:hypothetical protein
MPRPYRSWIRKTYTVSEDVEAAIAMRAAKEGIETGTVVDIIVWNALLKPDEARIKAGDFTKEQVDRIFAEEALALLNGEPSIRRLASHLVLNDKSKEKNYMEIQRLVKQWKKARLIDSRYHQTLIDCFGVDGWVPSVTPDRDYESIYLEHKLADEVLSLLMNNSARNYFFCDLAQIDERITSLSIMDRIISGWKKSHSIGKKYQTVSLKSLVKAFSSRDLRIGIVGQDLVEIL